MRSIWKGHIRMGMVSAPIKLYNAIEEGEKIGLNKVHQCDDKKIGRVGYKQYCKLCEKDDLTNEEIVKGYRVSEDAYAVITKEEISNLKLKSTKIIDIDAFVPLDQIPLARYEEPKFIAPDGDAGVKVYAILRDAMIKTSRVGIGKVVLRDREDIVALVPNGHGIDMYVLRYPNQIRSQDMVPGLDKVKAEKVDKAHLEGMVDLMNALHSDFSEVEMVDHFNDAMRELVNNKIAGNNVAVAVAPKAAPAMDLMDALKASIAQVKDAKKAKKVKKTA